MSAPADSIAAFRLLAIGFCRWRKSPSLGNDGVRALAIRFAHLHAAAPLQLPEAAPDAGSEFPATPA